MASKREAESAAGEVGREAGALLWAGASVFLLLSLWAPDGTGQIGHLVCEALRLPFGASATLIPIVGIAFAANALLEGPSWSGSRWVALIGLLTTSAVFAEIFEMAPPRTLGGLFGEFVGVAVLRENFGVLGTYSLLVPIFLWMILLATSTSMREAVERARSGFSAAGSGVAEAIARGRERLRARPEEERAFEAERPAPRFVEVARGAVRRPPEPRDESSNRPPPIIVRPSATPPRPAKKGGRTKQESLPFGGDFRLPPTSFLDEPVGPETDIDTEALEASARVLEVKLGDFGVKGRVTAVRPGPVITTFEFEPAPGVKVNRIVSLADDLSMALRAMSVRILAPIPGKAVVGIEVSNPKREKVFLREILESDEFHGSASKLMLALGKDSVGRPVVSDLAKMPHLLVAGATGAGKSVSLNAMIMSILMKATPDEVRFLMIDPKILELALYENVPHLLTRVVTDPKEACAALTRAVVEMETRYKLLRDKGVRNIDSYNRVLDREAEAAAASDGVIVLEQPVDAPDFDDTVAAAPVAEKLPHRRLPYIVVVIDELADLMMTTGRQVEEQITRLAQKARAAGIHLILATQRPSVDVITGLIKANFPARISFQVTSRVDSRTILDSIGAERLLGGGDMLFQPPGTGRQTRVHGAFVSDAEVGKAVAFLKDQARPVFDESFTRAIDTAHDEESTELDDADELIDEMYDKAIQIVAESQQASISWLQRRLRVGYNRAARMIERMERDGLVGPSEGVRPREIHMRAAEPDA